MQKYRLKIMYDGASYCVGVCLFIDLCCFYATYFKKNPENSCFRGAFLIIIYIIIIIGIIIILSYKRETFYPKILFKRNKMLAKA